MVVERLEARITAARLLAVIKKFETYGLMSRQFDLPITVINRYVKGKVLPSYERAMQIVKVALPIYLKRIYDYLKREDFRQIETDPDIVDVLTDFFALKALAGKRITAVIPVVPEAIPIACLIATKIHSKIIIPRTVRRPKDEVMTILVDFGEYFTQSFYLRQNIIRGGRRRPDDVLLVCKSMMKDRPIVEAFIEHLRKHKIGLAAVLALMAPPWEYEYPVVALLREL